MQKKIKTKEETEFDYSIEYGSSRKPVKIDLAASDFYISIHRQASANLVQIFYDSKTLPFDGGAQLLATLPLQDEESEGFAFVEDTLKRITEELKDGRNA